jgi:uncharacterized protein YndB with AHSA1/START domain
MHPEAPRRHDQLVMSGSATILIAASATTLYEMVTDVTRMGQWSPHTLSCEWLDGATSARVGARFDGKNRGETGTWTMAATVVVADRPVEFAFVTGKPEGPATTWRYQFQQTDGVTLVTESFEWAWKESRSGFRAEVGSQPIDVARRMVDARQADLVSSMEATLANLRRAAESERDRGVGGLTPNPD